ncbi:hypothetical protein AJ78_05199 [Emergomyces pasteurianus Ep9510]|uniref:Uncharacterized protein n=1 Tax=Emergomyces pasteurianus Ep9510 TaxID=1447872 RepID=A0A1J9PD15_9EURO|nr:hypothetical protein AJ78_05199 [Emergomyces pasteurianus Ep9510]
MFVNLGLTADAAAAHTHEFSDQGNSQSNNSFLSRSSAALFPLGFMSSTKNQPNSRAQKPLMSQPSVSTPPLSPSRLSSDDEEYGPADSSEPGLHNRTQDAPTVSVKKQPQIRTKSSFSFAHPPPSTRRKRLALRPKLLLQLHQVSQITRPIPAIDVLSSKICCVSRKFPNIYRGKDSATANDIVFVTSDSYEQLGTEDDRSISSDDDPQDHREVVATVCHHRKEGAKSKGMVHITLQQGSRWEASRLPSGGYEFMGTTESGEKKCVRWVLRAKAGSRRVSGSSSGADNIFDDGKRFTFSIIDPTTRRHPVLAWMGRQGIDILDQYPLFSSRTQGSSLPASPKSPRPTARSNLPPTGDPNELPLIETNDHLRTLIVVSGVWVAFREGWPQTPLYTDIFPSSPMSVGAGTSISSSSQQPPPPSHQQPPPQQNEQPQLTQSSGNTIEKVDGVGDNPQSKSVPFTGGRLLLGGPGLIHRAKTSKKKSNTSGSPRRAATRRKHKLADELEDQPSHDMLKHNSLQSESLTNTSEQTQTRRGSSSGGNHRQYLSAGINLPSPRYSSYGEDSLNDEISSPPSVYTGQGKPEPSKGKRWRRLSNWFDSVGKKGPV